MKKSLIIVITVVCAAVILASTIFSGDTVKTAAETTPAASEHVSFEEATLLKLLNENYVYGSDFEDVDDIVNCSVNNFKANVADEGYISDKQLCDFVYDMYGIEIVDLSKLNPEHAYKPGYVYALPAFTEYAHKNIKLTANEDGTITAKTDICVTSLDGKGENLKATTLFVKNDNSQFGYNIVYSEIYSDTGII